MDLDFQELSDRKIKIFRDNQELSERIYRCRSGNTPHTSDPELVDSKVKQILDQLVPDVVWRDPWLALQKLHDQPDSFVLSLDGVKTTIPVNWPNVDQAKLQASFDQLNRAIELGQDYGRRQAYY